MAGTTDLDAVLEIMLSAYAIDLDDEADELLGALDPMGETSEELDLRLQMALDRRSKTMTVLANLMKKVADSSGQLVQNIK